MPRLIITTLTDDTMFIDFEDAFYKVMHKLDVSVRDSYDSCMVEHSAKWTKQEYWKGEIPLWVKS